MEREPLQFVDSAIHVQERYEGPKEFLPTQHKEIESVRHELSKARSELEEHLAELQAREQWVAEDETW
jgi:predicted nuclease with TOPRIM domain